MKDIYLIPSYILDAYNTCSINWNAKQIKFPRRQFADALAKSGNTQKANQWFEFVAKETGLALTPNELFQICIRHHLTEYKPAKCPTCGKLLSLNSVKIGVQYCSNKCAQSDPYIKAKVQNTLKQHFGEKGLGSEEVRAKIKATNLKRYGTEHAASSKIVRDKIKATNLKRYGVENTYAAEVVKEKIKQVNIEKFGVDNPNKSKEIRDKIKQTNQKRYNGNAPICSNTVKSKIQSTMLNRYGVDVPSKSEEIKKKIQSTLLDKYGVTAPLKSSIIKEKYLKTNLEKYGAENPLKSSIIRSKIIKTRRINYYPKFLDLLKKKNISLLSSKEDYINGLNLKLKCGYCNTEWTKDHLSSITCPHCIHTLASKAEKDLLFYIKSLYSGPIIENTRKIIKPYELDIYLPEKKLAFEFNGTYWHSDICKPAKYHISKTRLCNKKKVRLIHIFEYEWMFNQEKIKNLIKSALGIFDVRLYARQCEVKEISHPEYKKFLELYHLQNSVNSSIRYGLYYKDELVSVIGFGKSRFKKGEVELHRYCVKAGYQIIGGFSKLIKHACKDANISEFISYIDLAHFSGRGYKKAGFKLVEVTNPSYIYIRGDEIKSRMQCQKHKLEAFLENFDPAKSEYENMLLNDWDRVYDCGNLKVKYTL